MRIARGFTLVELLVVLVVIGMLVGLATLVGGGDGARAARQEAERLAMLVPLLSDEAVIDNREFGLHFDRDSYQVLRHDDVAGRWVRLASMPAHRLPASVELQFVDPGDAATGSLSADSGSVDRSLAPHLLILSSGEWSPFKLRLVPRDGGVDGVAWRVDSDGYTRPVAALEAG